MAIHQDIKNLEINVFEPVRKDINNTIDSARRALREYIGLCCKKDDCSSLSIADAIDLAGNEINANRNVALVILRCLSIEKLIPENNLNNQIDRKIVKLIENATPDLCKFFKITDKKQTYEKISIIKSIHNTIMEKVSILKSLQPRLEGIQSIKAEINKSLNVKIVQNYLSIYDFNTIRFNIISIIDGVLQLNQIQDHLFGITLENQLGFLNSQLDYCGKNNIFLHNEYFYPFIISIKKLLEEITEFSKSRFECSLKPQKTKILEKRYPLYEPNRVIRVPIAFENEGPGIAFDVEAIVALDNDNVTLSTDNINLGDIPPGQFSIPLEIKIVNKTDLINFIIELSWRKASSAERNFLTIDAQILSQSPDVDWISLKDLEPYSTEIAEGDEFVGREEKVRSISNRLLKKRMQSTYITGQKRVGKTSLALAVEDNIKFNKKSDETEFFYLEWGDYSNADPMQTVEALGTSIADFLIEFIPSNVKIPNLNFNGTLAPLNKLSALLMKANVNKKFVIILDEFDEIHHEMYRHGSLAESFFSNIRTLSAKKNIAFMLVGGENMPFIISSQGDQLNKFVREPLDYFNRVTEWFDYQQLIKKPIKEKINWHETAITELYNLTNGHPYYTKLLCSRIFSDAIDERDIEITATEVNKSLDRVIPRLDINAFAHLWKDGIFADREEMSIYELKRCRFLVAVGRVLRRQISLTPDNILSNEITGKLQQHEIIPLINDYYRRGIFIEKDNEIIFQLPIFKIWLKEIGVKKLISDQLADELQKRVEDAEEAAYVTSDEITTFTENLHTYRGQKITSEEVRTWISQVEKYSNQRFLFTILSNIRFFSEYEIREKLKLAHRLILSVVKPFVRKHKSERRTDILVTYVDGPGKSGNFYASRYAEENLISSESVIEPNNLAKKINQQEEKASEYNGLIIIDDLVGSGKQLSGNLKKFLSNNLNILLTRPICILVVVIAATKEGEANVRETISGFKTLNIDLRVCEPIIGEHFAFNKDNKIWKDKKELEKAKNLCLDIGAKIYKNAPLGYAKQGLMIVFPNTCPNNSLPILHSGDIKKGWRPLFPRPKN